MRVNNATRFKIDLFGTCDVSFNNRELRELINHAVNNLYRSENNHV